MKFLIIISSFFKGYEYLCNGEFVKFKHIWRDSRGFKNVSRKNIVKHVQWG